MTFKFGKSAGITLLNTKVTTITSEREKEKAEAKR